MSKRLRVIVWAIALAVSYVVGCILANVPAWQTLPPVVLEVVQGLPGFLVSFVLLLYHSSDKVYFWIHRTFRFLNPWATVNLSMAAEFDVDESRVVSVRRTGDGDRTTVLAPSIDTSMMERVFCQHFPKAQVRSGEEERILIATNLALTVTLSSQAYDDDGLSTLRFESNALEITYRQVKELIDDLNAFFAAIKREMPTYGEKYTMAIAFDELNPYLGFFLQRARVPRPLTFDVEFEESVGEAREVVRIQEKEVGIVAETLAGWQKLSEKYALLRVPANAD